MQKLKLIYAAVLISASLPALADLAAAGSTDYNNHRNIIITTDTARYDALITGKVKNALEADYITHYTNIDVTTQNGTVVLSGIAKSETEAAKVIEIAEITEGVKNIDTRQLQVANSNHPLDDSYITAKIKGLFIKNNLTSGQENLPLTGVKIETQNGIVYLSGTVKTPTQIHKLVRLAKSVDGVKNVKATLSISLKN